MGENGDDHAGSSGGSVAQGDFDSGRYDASHAADSHIKKEYPTKPYNPIFRPAEQNVEDPMAKYRKWGYEQWPPEHEGVPFVVQPDVDSPFYRYRQWLHRGLMAPAKWAHDSLEKWRESRPGWKRPVYYHRRFTRVTPVDQCEEGDLVCLHEANTEYFRDMKVEGFMVSLLRERVEHCFHYEKQDWARKCKKLIDDWVDANTNYKIKYGEMGTTQTVLTAFMKQKHRMIWERRNPDKMAGLYGYHFTDNRYYPPEQIQYDADYPRPK